MCIEKCYKCGEELNNVKIWEDHKPHDPYAYNVYVCNGCGNLFKEDKLKRVICIEIDNTVKKVYGSLIFRY